MKGSELHSICLLIGGQRCGSTSTYKMLTKILTPEKYNSIKAGETEPKLLLQPIKRTDYLNYFATTQFIIDKSTSYFDNKYAPLNAFNAVPDAKILAVLRNPVDRAISHWAFSMKNGHETKSLVDIITNEALQLRPFSGISVSPYKYLDRGYYAKHLRNWNKYFPNSQIRIVILEELNREKTLINEVARFLAEKRLQTSRLSLITDDGKLIKLNSGSYPGVRTSELSEAKHLLHQYYRNKNKELEVFMGRKIMSWS